MPFNIVNFFKQRKKFTIRILLISIVFLTLIFRVQYNYANSDLSKLFDDGERVKFISNPNTGREKIFDINGNVLLASYNSQENVGIVVDEYSKEQKLIYKTVTGIVIKENGYYYEEGGVYQRERIAKKIVFYDLEGKEIGIENDDYYNFYFINNKLIINCWTNEKVEDEYGCKTYKKEMKYYSLDKKDREETKLFDDFGVCKLVNDNIFLNFGKGDYFIDNEGAIDTNLYIFDIDMFKKKIVKSIDEAKINKVLYYSREVSINNKKYYEVYYERYLAGQRIFYNLLDENFEYVFVDDIMINNGEERDNEYEKIINIKRKLRKYNREKDNIFEKVINAFYISDAKELYYIVKDENYIRILDNNYNDIIEKVELPYLHIQNTYGIEVDGVEEKIFYVNEKKSKDYYSIQDKKLVKILSVPIDIIDNEGTNNTKKVVTSIISTNDGYFYPLTFKYYNDEYGDEYYDTLYLDEITLYNKNQNVLPITINSNWVLDNKQFKFERDKAYDESSPFKVMPIKNKRLIRVTCEEEENSTYVLIDENGEKYTSTPYLCKFLDSDNDIIIISTIKDGTTFYDLDFNVIGHFDKIYNQGWTVTLNEPYGKLFCLCTKLRDNSYDEGTIIIDKKINVVKENVKDTVYIIPDEANYERNKKIPMPYRYLLFMEGVDNVKYKNGDTKFESSIVDLDFNKIFKIDKKILREEQFFNEDKHMAMTLHIYDGEYVLFDSNMSIIERGTNIDGCYDYIKEKYKNDYRYRTENGTTYKMPYKTDDEVFKKSMGWASETDENNYVNLKRPDYFKKINIKDNIVLYKNEYEIKKDNTKEDEDVYLNTKYYYRYTLVNTLDDKIIAKEYLNLTDFKDNYFKYANGFDYGYMDYDGNKLISFGIFDDI